MDNRGLKFKKHAPIELQQWGMLIPAIESKVNNLEQKMPRSIGKNECLEFYRGLIGELRAFQHLWRDPGAHARKQYDPFDAGKAFIHVRDFMGRLSRKLSEARTKPVTWKKGGGNLVL